MNSFDFLYLTSACYRNDTVYYSLERELRQTEDCQVKKLPDLSGFNPRIFRMKCSSASRLTTAVIDDDAFAHQSVILLDTHGTVFVPHDPVDRTLNIDRCSISTLF